MSIVESLYRITEAKSDNVLYHATYGVYLDSIKKDGLIPGKNKNWNDSSNNVIDLADDPDFAASFCEVAEVPDEVYDSGIFVISIDADKLDKSKIEIDKNNLAQDSLEYKGNIPTSCFLKIEEYE